jgi:hypothetical protein
MRPRASLDLIEIDDPLEAQALRSALEWWNVQVHRHLVGEAKDMVRLLEGGGLFTTTVFLLCHGTDEGILLPQLAGPLEAEQPYHHFITPDDLRGFARLPGCLVVNTGCATGSRAFAETFLEVGCQAYIAPDGYPDGDASLFFLLSFCYQWLCLGRELHTAHTLAAGHDSETGLFKLFE